MQGPVKGGLYENLIFDMLTKRGINLHFFKHNDNTQEIEFIIEQNMGIVPIEVKSKNGSTISLNEYIKDWHPTIAYKLSGGNMGTTDGKITIPHYLAMFI